MAGGECGHGYRPGAGKSIEISGARERRADEHEKRCRGARLFNHSGFLGRIVCCATCGRKVC